MMAATFSIVLLITYVPELTSWLPRSQTAAWVAGKQVRTFTKAMQAEALPKTDL
jgi:hypothetical protein